MTLIVIGIICWAVAGIGAMINVGLGMKNEFKKFDDDPWGDDDGFWGIFYRQAVFGIIAIVGVVLIAFGILSLV